jgi:hypothetical protein
MPLDSFEYIVRPYTTPSPHGGIIIPSTPSGSRERATITWGAKSTMPDVQGVNFNTICCKDNLTEKDRKSNTKRIFQNGDESSPNWVDVERPYELNLDKKEHNHCQSPLEEISGVAQEVSATLAEFDDLVHSGTTAPADKNCSQNWKFKNGAQ